MQTKYPDVKVKLTETDGNAFSILARVDVALRKAGVSSEERQQFYAKATSGDYNNLLATAMQWVDVS